MIQIQSVLTPAAILLGANALFAACAVGRQNGSGDGGSLVDDAGSVGGEGGVGGADCVTKEAVAGRIPLDVVLLLDRSGSLLNHGDLWTPMKASVSAFLHDPESAGINIGVVYFPAFEQGELIGIDPRACDASLYQKFKVDMTALPGGAQTVESSMGDAPAPVTEPTPMRPAIEGGYGLASNLRQNHPDHKVVLVLSTDGVPTGCVPYGWDPPITSTKTAYKNLGVPLYVIGVQGSVLSELNKLAAAGGTKTALDVTQDISQFSAALAKIRNIALPCEYSIPSPPDGAEIDYGLINVNYTSGAQNSVTQLLPKAENAAECGSKAGWYYDDPSHPTKVVLCPVSCEAAKVDPGGTMKLAFGCATIVF